MKIIIGLGNPGEKYELTRHNVGFMALDFLMPGHREHEYIKFRSVIRESQFNGKKILMATPQTFMNHSGEAVREIAEFYKLNPADDILVLHDEVDLPFGTIRTTASSSSAGQNGVQNIIDELGTQDFHRVRIGVETRQSRADMETRDFVLQNFASEELERLKKEIFPKISLETERFLK